LILHLWRSTCSNIPPRLAPHHKVSQPDQMTLTTPEHRPTAIAFMALASSLIAGTTLLAKALGTDTLGPALHPLQITHGRFVFAWIAIATAVAVLRPKINATNLKMHVLRTSFGATGITLMFAAVAFIPVSDATAISFLNLVPFSYATLVFAAAYDMAAFGTVPDATSLVGAGVIIAGAAVLAWREGRAPRPFAAKP